MPRIKSRSAPQAYHSLNAELKDDKGSCAVVALAAICHVSASVAQAALLTAGRKKNQGTFNWQMIQAAGVLGFEMKSVPFIDQLAIIKSYPGAHKNLHSITTHHPVRFSKAWAGQPDYLMFVKGHVAAYVDGQVVDWTVGRAKRVISLYTVTKIEER